MLGLEVQTRFMINMDFDRVVEINYTSSGDYAWESEDLFQEWKSEQGVGIVAVDADDYTVGFCVYNLNDKECYEIKHLVVERSLQRSGIGTALINRMKDKLNDRRYILSYSIPEEHIGFQLFLKKMGFKAKIIKNGMNSLYRFQYEKV